MTRHVVTPYKGSGPIMLGMISSQVHTAMGYAPKSFRKAPSDKFLTDNFAKDGINVFYGNNGSVDAIEYYGPTKPEFKDETFLKNSEKWLISWLDANDRGAQMDSPDYTSAKFGLAFYIFQSRVASVLVYAEGYF